MMRHISRFTPPGWATVAMGTLLVLLPALYNGFPMVYSDTGTYLRSAFTGFVPVDRPYWYGAFIRGAALGGTWPWAIVIVQAFLCSGLLWALWRRMGDGRPATFLLSLAVLSPFTGLGWYAGQLMPDILTAIGLLAALLLLFAPGRAGHQLLLALLVLACSWAHLSNLMILPLVLALTALAALRWKVWPGMRRVVLLAAVLVLAWPGLWWANRAVSGQGHLSRFSHVFLMGRLIDNGMLPAWLDEHCPTDSYGLCAHRDSLPTSSRELLWSERSPLVWQGGADAVRDEYTTIFRATLTQPRYLWMHVQGSLASTWSALRTASIADELEGIYYRQDYSPPYGQLAQHAPQHLPAYLAARQNTGSGTLHLAMLDHLYRVLYVLALLGAGWLALRGRLAPLERVLLVFGITTVVGGAWVGATFSTVDVRFMARTAWMLPAVVMVLGWGRVKGGEG